MRGGGGRVGGVAGVSSAGAVWVGGWGGVGAGGGWGGGGGGGGGGAGGHVRFTYYTKHIITSKYSGENKRSALLLRDWAMNAATVVSQLENSGWFSNNLLSSSLTACGICSFTGFLHSS